MYKIKDSRLNIITLFYFFMICIGIADATNSNYHLVCIATPWILVFTSFYFGLTKVNLGYKENLVLFGFNIIFLLFTYKTKIFILNIFLISLLIWVLITPFVVRVKGYFIGASIVLIFLSFVIPYYKLEIPILLFLYYPFYLFGYMARKLQIKKDIISKIYIFIAITLSMGALAIIFAKLLGIRDIYGLVYIQKLYNQKAIFVYSPIIVVNFLILCFSILMLLLNVIDFISIENNNGINWRAAIISVSIMLTPIFVIYTLHLGQYPRCYLFAILASLYLVLYIILDRKFRYSTYKNYEEIIVVELNINKIYSKILLMIFFVLTIVISIEYVLRNNNAKLTIDYAMSASFAYNLIFVSILYLFIVSLTGTKLGSLIMFSIHIFLLLANNIKIKFFNEPFYIWDIYLIKSAFIISRNYVKPPVIIIISIVFVVCLTLTLKNLRWIAKILKPTPNIRLVVWLSIPLIFNFYLINNSKFVSINIFKDWYDGIDEYLRNGTYVENYLYLKDLDKYLNKKPDNYSEHKIKQIKNQIAKEEKVSDIKPNVIVILSETFWDIRNFKDIQINKQIYNNLNMYKNSTMISPRFGGGTANIEFEVLTGLSNFYFSAGIIPYNVYFNHNIPSVVDAFKDGGYATVAVHPNIGTMYNRNKVYKYLGFNDFKDISSFNFNEDIKGNYVSDDRVVDKILDILKEGENPKFIFGITIQNHDPYNSSSKNYKNREIEVKSDKLDNIEKDIISNYAQGVYDADKALGKLLAEVKKTKKPTLVYYFGDHLPRLGEPKGIFDIYEKLNYIDKEKRPENDRKFYETPLIRWSNYKQISELNTPISTNQLAIEILKDAEIKYPDYFNYLIKLREKYPYLNNYLINKDKILNDDIIKNYYLIQYDIMFGNQYIKK